MPAGRERRSRHGPQRAREVCPRNRSGEPRYNSFGRGMSRSRQVFRAVKRLISVWRGWTRTCPHSRSSTKYASRLLAKDGSGANEDDGVIRAVSHERSLLFDSGRSGGQRQLAANFETFLERRTQVIDQFSSSLALRVDPGDFQNAADSPLLFARDHGSQLPAGRRPVNGCLFLAVTPDRPPELPFGRCPLPSASGAA